MGQATSVGRCCPDRPCLEGGDSLWHVHFFLLRVLRFYCIYSMANVQKMQAIWNEVSQRNIICRLTAGMYPLDRQIKVVYGIPDPGSGTGDLHTSWIENRHLCRRCRLVLTPSTPFFLPPSPSSLLSHYTILTSSPLSTLIFLVDLHTARRINLLTWLLWQFAAVVL